MKRYAIFTDNVASSSDQVSSFLTDEDNFSLPMDSYLNIWDDECYPATIS